MSTPIAAMTTTSPAKARSAKSSVPLSRFSSASKNIRFQALTVTLRPMLATTRPARPNESTQARRAVAPRHQPPTRRAKPRATRGS
jgi:hypothetical protein